MCNKSMVEVTVFIYTSTYTWVPIPMCDMSSVSKCMRNATTDVYINTSNVEYMCASPYTHNPSQFGYPWYLTFINYFRYFSRLFWQPFLPHLIPKAILEC